MIENDHKNGRKCNILFHYKASAKRSIFFNQIPATAKIVINEIILLKL